MVRVLGGYLAACAVLLAALGAAFTRSGTRAEFAVNNGPEPKTLDPAQADTVHEGRIVSALHEGLLGQDPATLAPVEGVAHGWSASPDGLRYTFRLRAGALWSNGDPLTAQDFVWSWLRVLDPATAAPYAYLMFPIQGAEAYHRGEGDAASVAIVAEGDLVLTVTLDHPVAYFLDLMSFTPFLPVHRGTVERHPDGGWQRPGVHVGNGPYVLADRRINDRIRLCRNDLYWDAARVGIGTVDLCTLVSADAALNLYLSGAIDWDPSLPPLLLPRLSQRPDYVCGTYLGTYYLRCNVRRPPLDDPLVRRAIALAIDRDSLVRHVTLGGETPTRVFVPAGTAGYRPPDPEEGGVEEARRLLAEAGYPGGRGLPPIEYLYNSGTELHQAIAEVVATRLEADLGIRLSLRREEAKQYWDSQETGDYQMARAGWIGDYEDPRTFLEMFVTGGEHNQTGWGDPRYDDLVDRAGREPGDAARDALYREAEGILLAAQPIIPLYHYAHQALVRPGLMGFHSNLRNVHPWKALRWAPGSGPGGTAP